MKNRNLFLAAGLGFICLMAFLVPGWQAVGQDAQQKGMARFRVVGYLPDYRVDQIDASVGRLLTDLVFFSVAPDPHGQFASKALDAPKTVELLKRLRNEQHVNLILCVGGWGRSKGFAEIASTEKSRRQFAEGLTAYCGSHGFSGADIDWEHPKDSLESQNYGRLMAAIALAFKPHGLKLSAAVAAWQTLTPEWIEAVDAVNLMSYDAPGKHSTLDAAQSDVRKLLDQKVPAEKIRLGLPFYGRGIVQRDLTKTYAEISKSNSGSINDDEFNGVYFNGPATIHAKTQFAQVNNLGGVMVWEIGQDAPGDASLLKVIQSTVK